MPLKSTWRVYKYFKDWKWWKVNNCLVIEGPSIIKSTCVMCCARASFFGIYYTLAKSSGRHVDYQNDLWRDLCLSYINTLDKYFKKYNYVPINLFLQELLSISTDHKFLELLAGFLPRRARKQNIQRPSDDLFAAALIYDYLGLPFKNP